MPNISKVVDIIMNEQILLLNVKTYYTDLKVQGVILNNK